MIGKNMNMMVDTMVNKMVNRSIWWWIWQWTGWMVNTSTWSMNTRVLYNGDMKWLWSASNSLRPSIWGQGGDRIFTTNTSLDSPPFSSFIFFSHLLPSLLSHLLLLSTLSILLILTFLLSSPSSSVSSPLLSCVSSSCLSSSHLLSSLLCLSSHPLLPYVLSPPLLSSELKHGVQGRC